MTDDRVPVPMRVRHVAPGDVFVSRRDGSHWCVVQADGVEWRIGGCELVAEHEGQTASKLLDPDHVLDVLVPVAEYDAVELLHSELGARLIVGRTT